MNRHGKKTHTILLLTLAIGMFGFAFALVPLYNVFCEITGLNGRTTTQATLLEEIEFSAVPTDRTITVGFLASAARGMPWEFRPVDREVVVRPGELNTTNFYVRNRSAVAVTGQAVPSVAPGQAALYLKKIECFCFEQQELPPNGEMELSVSFIVATDIPENINELTLSYTMFHIADATHEHMASHQD
jgi:cytochrome c oxidase assembly protein subunit 11